MVDYLFEEFPPLVCPCPCLDESKSKGNYWNCSSFCFLTLGGGEGGGSRLPSGCQVAFPPGAYRAVKIGYFQSQKRAHGGLHVAHPVLTKTRSQSQEYIDGQARAAWTRAAVHDRGQAVFFEKQHPSNASVSAPEHCYTWKVTISKCINAPKMCDLSVKCFIERWNTVVFVIPYVSFCPYFWASVAWSITGMWRKVPWLRSEVCFFFLLALPKSLFDERIKLAIFCRIVSKLHKWSSKNVDFGHRCIKNYNFRHQQIIVNTYSS